MVVVLCLAGIVASMQRMLDVLARPAAGTFSPQVRQSIDQAAALMRIAPRSRDYRKLEAINAEFGRKYQNNPGITLLHLVTGAAFLVLACLQFLRPIRVRWPAFHRWNGRAILAMVMLAAISGFFFTLTDPYGGLLEASAVLTFGSFFLYAAARGWIAIRRRQVAIHREWMIRMFAVALGIAVMRLGLVAVTFAAGWGIEAMTPTSFGITFWVGWLVTLGAAEAWIRVSRQPGGPGIQPVMGRPVSG